MTDLRHSTFFVWAKKNFFSSYLNGALSIILLLIIGRALWWLVDWAIVSSSWGGDAEVCRQSGGACWSFINEKARYILFGHYPFAEQWRPQLFVSIFFVLSLLSQFRRLWSKYLVVAWVVLPFVSAMLMWGGFFGLSYVEMEQWGGLPLTLALAFLGILLSYPLGILFALARRSQMPIIRALSVAYIEIIRGVPLISLLFMSSVVFPLFLPEGVTISKVLRAQIAIILFSSAYMAEVVRGGLQSVARGQYEAADAIGLNYAQKMLFVVLPQALKAVIAPTVNTFIGLFKDTSLVFIIALGDLMFTTKAASKDAEWLGFIVEAYIFTALIYFVFCYFISSASFRVEREFKVQ